MKLSVIIVNYNVRHFLEQAVSSALRALKNIQGEVIVVDNASVDDSVQMIRNNFPQVKVICQLENVGFAKANNLGLRLAAGEYILYLNPDTIVEEMCFEKCISRMDSHPEIGALGVPMLDGSGNYLPESKRGFPNLWNSFCKMAGLGRLFPSSRWFNGYYLGHLSYKESHYVDVLSGAFFFTRRALMEKIGGFDESYFMYGEDIDLSYRIQKQGYKNFYFTDTRIIHFKGESTSKGSLNYVKHFYQAMIIFARKHLRGFSAWGLGVLLTGLIWMHAGFYFFKNRVLKYWLLAFDTAIMLFGFLMIKKLWAQWYYDSANYYSGYSIYFNLILYVVVWLFSFWIFGIYDLKRKIHHLVLSVVVGFFINLMFYALLPEMLRSSRMVLLLSFLFTLIYVTISRLLIHKVQTKRWSFVQNNPKRWLWVGSKDDLLQVETMLTRSKVQHRLVHTVTDEQWKNQEGFWKDVIRVYEVDEIIFNERSLSVELMLSVMSQLKGDVSFKILNQSGLGIIGSSSKVNRGELYTMDFHYNLTQAFYRRQKRFFDIVFCLLLLVLSPAILWMYRHKARWFRNIWLTLTGKITWVGYSVQDAVTNMLPKLPPSVLNVKRNLIPESFHQHYLSIYAWNYTLLNDLEICLRDFLYLDANPEYGPQVNC